jgi:hypothetical protein
MITVSDSVPSKFDALPEKLHDVRAQYTPLIRNSRHRFSLSYIRVFLFIRVTQQRKGLAGIFF